MASLLRAAAVARAARRAVAAPRAAPWVWVRAPLGARPDLPLPAAARPCFWAPSSTTTTFSRSAATATEAPSRSAAVDAVSSSAVAPSPPPSAGAEPPRRGPRRDGGRRRDGDAGRGRAGGSPPASGSASSRFVLQVQTDARHVTRRDLVQLFAGCGVSASDVHVEYSPETHLPRSYWVTFPGEREREHAKFRDGQMLGPHKVRLTPRGAAEMEAALGRHRLLRGSLGRFVLVSGLERSASFSDLWRFFEGFALRPRAISFLSDVPALDWVVEAGLLPGRCALVRLATPAEAQRAARSLQWGHVLNSKVLIRVVE